MTAIVSSLSFNFLLVAAACSDIYAIWNLAYIFCAITIVSALICHFTQFASSEAHHEKANS